MAPRPGDCLRLLLWAAVLLPITPAPTTAIQKSADTKMAADRPGVLTPGSDSQEHQSGDVTSMSGDADVMAPGEVILPIPGSGSELDIPSSGRSELMSDPKLSDVTVQDAASSGETPDLSGQGAASSVTSSSPSPAIKQTTEKETTTTTTTTTKAMTRRGVGVSCDNHTDTCMSPLMCRKSKPTGHVCACPDGKYWSHSTLDCRDGSFIEANISLTKQGADNLTVSWWVQEPQDVTSYRIVVWNVLNGTDNEKHGSPQEGVTSPYQLSSLVPGHKYKVRVVSLTNYSQESIRSDEFYAQEPSSVQSLFVASTSENCVVLQWKAGEGVRRTFLVNTRSLELEVTPLAQQEVNVTSEEVCGLEPGSAYNFSVVSESNDLRSTAVYVQAWTKPVPPSSIKVTRNSTCVSLTWTEPQGRYDVIRAELVQTGSAGAPQGHSVTAVGTAAGASVCGLLAGETYDVRVTSERANLTSEEEKIALGMCAARVTNVSWTEVGLGRVLVTWQGQGRVQHYVTKLRSDHDLIPATLNDSTWRPNQTLEYGVAYRGSILASANNCSDGETFFNVTLHVPRPADVTVNVTWSVDEGLRVTWRPPPPTYHVVTAYSVELLQGGRLFRTERIPGNQTTWTGLVPRGRCYSVAVYAENSQGRSDVTPVSIRVPQDAPGPVANLNVEHTEVGVVTVQWEPPTQPNGLVIGYELSVIDSDTGIQKQYYFNCTENCNVTCPEDGALVQQSFSDVDTREVTPGTIAYVFNVTEFCPPASLEVRLVAWTSFGPGNASNASTSLEEEEPGQPSAFKATTVNSTSILLEWAEPSGRDRCNVTVTSYRLTYSIATPTPEPLHTTFYPWMTSTPSPVRDQQSTRTVPSSTFLRTSFFPMTSAPPKSTPQLTPSFLTSFPYPSYLTSTRFREDATASPIGQSSVTVTVDGTNRRFLLAGLDYWTPYSFVLAAEGWSGTGTSVQAYASTDEHVPTSAVRDLEVTSKSTTSLNVTYIEPLTPNGLITHYHVEVWTQERTCSHLTAPPTPLGPWKNMTSHSLDINLEDLAPYWSYDVTVVPCTRMGCGTLNATVQGMTLPDVPSSMENTTFSVDHLEAEAAMVSWTPVCHVNADPSTLGYTVEYRPTLTPHQVETLSTQNSTGLLKELRPLTNYSIRVSANNSQGNGSFSDWTELFKTPNKAPEAIVFAHVSTPNATCISVTWTGGDVVSGSPVAHKLVVRDRHDGTNRTVSCPSSQAAGRVCQECGLTPFWDYSVSLLVENDVGKAETPTPVNVSTPGTAPGPVQNLSISVTAEDDVTAPRLVNVTWSPPLPRQRHGVITGYVITVLSYRSSPQVLEMQVESVKSSYTRALHVAAEDDYSVEVTAKTEKGTGPPLRTPYNRVPAGALPEPREDDVEAAVTQQVNTTLRDPSRHLALSLPTAFLCNTTFGRPLEWGVVVQREPPLHSEKPYRGPSRGYPSKYPGWSETRHTSQHYVQLRDFNCPRSNRFTVEMGLDEDCKALLRGQCNGPLLPSTNYRFRAFMCTKAGCTETPFSQTMRTADPQRLQPALIAVIVFLAVVVVSVIIVAVVVVIRRRRKSSSRFPTEKIGMRMMDSARSQRVTASTGSEFTRSRPVKLVNFAQHVEAMHQQSNLGFSDEFKRLKAMSPLHSTKTAELPACKGKNRYHNILPFDRTRVKLLPNDDEEGSDYINGNFIMGYSHKREYIATQGPLPGTADDFWRMVWEQKVKVIVMLTQCVERGKVKCEQYWPECGEPVYYGDLLVQVRSQSVLPSYVIRIVDLVLGDSKRTVKHFHFLKWPDFGCPEKTWLLLNFVSAVRSHTPHDSGPLIIHCSAGVGRTGTFIAVDYALQHIKEHDELDILGLVLQMRDSRTQMVQNESQYIYIHDCVRDALEEETDDEEEDEEMVEEANEHVYMNASECNGNLARA